ncbi:transposase [Streptomyces sp. NPDC006267]|uniref:transposase n=1 Tax=Streptomyces sp. NPDC006267 TaxID=3157173 RepID=UPI0033BE9E69
MGRPQLDDRRMLNGIMWKFRAGVAWRDVPERYGSWASLHTRFRRWAADGTRPPRSSGATHPQPILAAGTGRPPNHCGTSNPMPPATTRPPRTATRRSAYGPRRVMSGTGWPYARRSRASYSSHWPSSASVNSTSMNRPPPF